MSDRLRKSKHNYRKSVRPPGPRKTYSQKQLQREEDGHLERARNIKEQSSIHLADNRKRRQEHAQKQQKVKGNQKREMAMLEQAFVKIAAEESV